MTEFPSFLGHMQPLSPLRFNRPVEQDVSWRSAANLWQSSWGWLHRPGRLMPKLLIPCVLALPSLQGEHTVDANTRNWKIGGDLEQKQPYKTGAPVRYRSPLQNSPKRKNITINRRLLAVFQAVLWLQPDLKVVGFPPVLITTPSSKLPGLQTTPWNSCVGDCDYQSSKWTLYTALVQSIG